MPASSNSKLSPALHWRSTAPGNFVCSHGSCQTEARQSNPLEVQLAKLPGEQSHTIQIDFGSPITSDVYIRENDLVFTGEETENSPVRTQAYIRTLADEEACDLILSRQTSLLDYAAPVSIATEASEIFRLVDGQLVAAQSDSDPGEEVALAAPINADLAICLLVFPGDADAIVIDQGQLAVRCFTSPLEKGVIRQVRIRALLVERAGLAETLAQKYATFRQSELPLTT